MGVVEMADLKIHMFRHLRSAKDWLTRAEESFDKDSNIRGELDLFLAQAELQHFREATKSRQWRYKYPFLRHAISFILATTIVTVGFGAFWWSSERDIAVPVPLAAQEQNSIPVTQKVVGEVAITQVRAAEPQQNVHVATIANSSPVVTPTAERQERAEHLSQPETEKLLPPDEMQKIIRAAGKSLRGQ
jgi:hypothetical protein